ncbi:MAG: GEVED domain-containing protein [Bacteroidales bacterium]|jgi:hypothetical protein|nr:GEVED domain-containing protein [Bacteroidales bacterium]
MKKLSLLCLILSVFSFSLLKGQSTVLGSESFENGVPFGWTATSNVTSESSLASDGNSSIKLKASTTEITLTSPVYNRTPGRNIRLEFNHIPMLGNASPGTVQIKVGSGNWQSLTFSGSTSSPTCYDNSYGGGIRSVPAGNAIEFKKINYWNDATANIPITDMDNDYWRHEVFYFNPFLTDASETSFQIRFRIGAASGAALNFTGWLIDDVRVYESSVEGGMMRIVQMKSFYQYPNVFNYPNRADVPIIVKLGKAGTNYAVNDSLYIEYMVGSSTEILRAPTTLYSSADSLVGYIPFSGFDTIVKWRLIVNNNYYDRTTYPFVNGAWNTFRNVREYVGDDPFQTTGLSNQELMFVTNQRGSRFQFRYRASELKEKGMSAGRITALGYNVTQATSGFIMRGFNVYMANLDTTYILSPDNPYESNDLSGRLDRYFNANLVAPPVGDGSIVLDKPFIWDGESDILIQTCWDNPQGTALGGVTKIESVVAPGAQNGKPAATTYKAHGVAQVVYCIESQWNSQNGSIGYRPNFKFIFSRYGKLAYDVGVDSTLIIPNNGIVAANTPSPFKIKINNYGSSDATGVRVYYKINNNAPVLAGTYFGLIQGDPEASFIGDAEYQFPSNITFPAGYNHIKVWTDSIVNQIDWEPENDTAYFDILACDGPLSGNYAIGNVAGISAERTFSTFDEAFSILKQCGVSAPVIFKIANLPEGEFYRDTLMFPSDIAGASATNYIKFISATATGIVYIKPHSVGNYNIDLSQSKYLKFERIAFVSADNCLNSGLSSCSNNIIQMSSTTTDIEFAKCLFINNTYDTRPAIYNGAKPNIFVNIANAKNIVIDSCTFDGDANTQISIQGTSPTDLSDNTTIKNSHFINNLNGAISVNYAQNITIDSCFFLNNRTTTASSINTILMQNSKNFKITKNLFDLNNVSAIAVSDAMQSNIASIVANNKITITNNNNLSSAANLYGINIISGYNVLVAYNSIYAKDFGTSLVSYGLNLGSNSLLSDIRVKNNIILSDGNGYAVYARPSSGSTLDFSNNVYWKLATDVAQPSNIVWRYNNTNCQLITDWQTALGGDANSYFQDPIFNASNNLTTTNTFLCYKAVQLTEVTNDYANNPRPTETNPCVGAYQFDPPPSNIFVSASQIEAPSETSVASDGLTTYSACGLSNEYITVSFSNISSNIIPADNLKLWYKINNNVVPASQKDTIHFEVHPDTTYTYTFRNPYNFSVNGSDNTFKVTVFSILSADTVRSNDTIKYYVNSRYELPALAGQTATINYGDSALLAITSNDSIYWYLNIDDATPYMKNQSYQTSRLFSDTAFYYSRKQEIPMVKISEIQINNSTSSDGRTTDMPSWVPSTSSMNIVELSNYGNGDLNLNGYTLSFVGGNTDSLSLPMKNLNFGNVTINKNSTLSIVFRSSAGASNDSSIYMYVNLAPVTTSQKSGFLLRDPNDNIIDAVALNGGMFKDTLNIPASVWSGMGKKYFGSAAGFIRSSLSASDSNGWTISDASHLMSIGTINDDDIVYRDNGCFGAKSTYNVIVSGVPSVDPGLISMNIEGLTHQEACTLTEEHIQVEITNIGAQTCNSTPIVLEVYENDILINTYYDTCNIAVAPTQTITYTLSNTVDLSANTSDRTFSFVCYSNLDSDLMHDNDTVRMNVTSIMTPYAPTSLGATIPYASSTTLTATSNDPNDIIIWYDSPTTITELSRGDFTTPTMFLTDTFYVASMIMSYDTIEIGDATTQSSNYPAPFNATSNNSKEQYLYIASELNEMGFERGMIRGIKFDISSIGGNINLLDFKVRLGTTSLNAIDSWEGNLIEVLNIDTLEFINSSENLGWKELIFTTPFYYDGESNLIVEVCSHNTLTGSNNRTIKTYYTQTDFNSVVYYNNNDIDACAWTGSPLTNATNKKKRPNIGFVIDKFGCSSIRTPVEVVVGPPPACEAGLVEITNPNQATQMSGIPIDISVKIKNFGTDPISSLAIDWTINGIAQTQYSWTGNLLSNEEAIVSLGSYTFSAGQNTIKAWTVLPCDAINGNDTSSFTFSACVGNDQGITYFTIGDDPTDDYSSIADVVNALINSGTCGDVVLNINPKDTVYNEQISIPFIVGTDVNTITFRGNAADSSQVVLRYDAGENTDKYAIRLDGAKNIRFENFTIENLNCSYPTTVEILNGASNIEFESMAIKSAPVIDTDYVSNLVYARGPISNITFNKVYFSSGEKGINLYSDNDSLSDNITITNSFFENFKLSGAELTGITNLLLSNNKFREYSHSVASKAISVRNLYGDISINKNDIYLREGSNARIGISAKGINASTFNPAQIYNNAISISGPNNTTAVLSTGIDIDTAYGTNIYYNTVRLRASNNSTNSKCLNIGKEGANIRILNNNLSNLGKGYAYYVATPTTQVISSNNNNYDVNGTRFAFWGAEKSTLELLQTANLQDAQSITATNPFIEDSLLALSYPSLVVRAAEPLDDVSDDILGMIRPISPKPTIGAYEYQFDQIDGGPISVIDPLNTVQYIENDPINVKVRIKNFGLYGLNSFRITAQLKYYSNATEVIEEITQDFSALLNSLDEAEFEFTDKLHPPLHFASVNDSINLRIFTTITNDANQVNDTLDMNIKVIPAYNLQMLAVPAITERCKLFETPIRVKVKNVGEKTVSNADNIYLTYYVENRPDLTRTEQLSFPQPDENELLMYDSLSKNQTILYTFNSTANLYPLVDEDIIWKLSAALSFDKDHVPTNDSTNGINVNSRVSPHTPITHDTVIHYGTWAKPWGEQTQPAVGNGSATHLAIKWFADSTADPFYSPSQYSKSVQYETTQLFTDSTFYLRTQLTGSYPCESYYAPLHVTLMERSPKDAACIGLTGEGPIEPPEEGWVFMSDRDTIKVKVANYGTTPITEFDITYCIKPASPANADSIIVTEHSTTPIPADGSIIYRFNTLADFSSLTSNYKIRAWVDAQDDATALNDTSNTWLVKPKKESAYPPSQSQNPSSWDITRVQLSNIDNPSNNLGFTYTNFTNSVPPALLFKGIYDSIYITPANASTMANTDERVGGWVRVFIDWDRNGSFEATELVYSDTVITNTVAKGRINVPANTLIGRTKMRIILWQGASSSPFGADASPLAGEVEDYLVFVMDPFQTNAEMVKFTSPDNFLSTPEHEIKCVLRNAGLTTITSATINWSMTNPTEGIISNTYNWSGSLSSGERTEIVLQALDSLPQGQTIYKAWVDVNGEQFRDNDTIQRTTYMYKTFEVPYSANFDSSAYDDFFAYNANALIPDNCWEFGVPDSSNTTIKTAYSAPNCWKTKLSGKYPANNESVLYSPIFDISVIKPDTLSFYMRRELGTGSYFFVEYTALSSAGYEFRWRRLGTKDDENATNWYNSDSNRFEGTQGWQERKYSLNGVASNFGNVLQLRFVFHSATATKDGIAIDNVEIKRAKRPQDAGVVDIAITPTELPNYGSMFYPKVKIRNHGTEPLTRVKVYYATDGMNIPVEEILQDVNILPGDTLEYTFQTGKYVLDNMPNPFNIVSFTRLDPTDIYFDNDSSKRQVVIGPLNKDASALSILTPNANIVANTDIEVSMLIKNLGLQPINTLPVSYEVSGVGVVTEIINFNPPLFNSEEYIYNFQNKYRSSFGTANLRVWTGLDGDYYHNNDTLFKRIIATSQIKDVEAKTIMVDDYASEDLGIQLNFTNNGNIGMDSIIVGYYYNGDSTNSFEELYRNGELLTAGSEGCHYFSQKLPRRNAPYSGICAYVIIPDDDNLSNNRTCTLYKGRRDFRADTIYIENSYTSEPIYNPYPLALVQLRARNVGTIGSNYPFTAGYFINGNWAEPYIQTFDEGFLEPNQDATIYLTFDQKIPLNVNGIYDIVAWVNYPYDANRSNDTTLIYKVVDLIGMDDISKTNEFTLYQNVPNPLNNSTTIKFFLPKAGNTRFFIIDAMGKRIMNENKFYLEGENEIRLNNLNLSQGVYYYIMEFEGKKISKKMIVVR